MSIELLLKKINNICESLTSMITDNNEGYYTELAIKKLRKVFKKCASDLNEQISRSSSKELQEKLCKEITDLCNFLKFNVIDLASLLVTSQPVKAPKVFFIGVEKHDTDGFLPVDSHSLKLFDNFVNSIIDGIAEKNIIMYPLQLMTHMEDMETEIVTTSLSNKRLFLFLTEIGTKYQKLMASNKINLVNLPIELEVELQTYLPENMYNSLPYELSQYKVEPLNGGSKSRRKHPRHRKPVRKTRRGHKSKSKPKTHRRGRHSHVRKHKKYTRKY